jgi:uncharacterized membrane protein YphA (DoxX/SURF4 family)
MPDEVTIIAALALAAVFLASGVLKLVRPGSLEPVLGELGVGVEAARRLALSVGVIEITVALALGRGIDDAWIVATLVLVSFTVVLSVAVRRGAQVGCGCFGDVSAAPVGLVHLARNVVFLAGAVVASRAPSDRPAAAIPAALAVAMLAVFVPESIALLRDFRRRAAEEIATTRGERKDSG